MFDMLTLRHSKGISHTNSAAPAYHLSLSSEELAALLVVKGASADVRT